MADRHERRVAGDPAGHVDRGVPGRAAGAVGHRDEGRLEALQLAQDRPELALALGGLGREELEGVGVAAFLEQLGDRRGAAGHDALPRPGVTQLLGHPTRLTRRRCPPLHPSPPDGRTTGHAPARRLPRCDGRHARRLPSTPRTCATRVHKALDDFLAGAVRRARRGQRRPGAADGLGRRPADRRQAAARRPSATGAGAAPAARTAPASCRRRRRSSCFQAAALIHDDVMDGSDTRRGQPAVHRRFAALHRGNRWLGSSEGFGVAGAILPATCACRGPTRCTPASGLPRRVARGRSGGLRPDAHRADGRAVPRHARAGAGHDDRSTGRAT